MNQSRKWADVATCYLITGHPEGAPYPLQRGFIVAQSGTITLPTVELDPSTQGRTVLELWGPALQAAGWEMVAQPRAYGATGLEMTVGLPA